MAKGSLPQQAPLVQEGALKLYGEDKALGTTLDAAIAAHLKKVHAGDYVAITQYFLETPEAEALVQQLRLAVRAKTGAAATTGYGPRFLHSTGQLHKGGGNNGVFLQLTSRRRQGCGDSTRAIRIQRAETGAVAGRSGIVDEARTARAAGRAWVRTCWPD